MLCGLMFMIHIRTQATRLSDILPSARKALKLSAVQNAVKGEDFGYVLLAGGEKSPSEICGIVCVSHVCNVSSRKSRIVYSYMSKKKRLKQRKRQRILRNKIEDVCMTANKCIYKREVEKISKMEIHRRKQITFTLH